MCEGSVNPKSLARTGGGLWDRKEWGGLPYPMILLAGKGLFILTLCTGVVALALYLLETRLL